MVRLNIRNDIIKQIYIMLYLCLKTEMAVQTAFEFELKLLDVCTYTFVQCFGFIIQLLELFLFTVSCAYCYRFSLFFSLLLIICIFHQSILDFDFSISISLFPRKNM